MNAVKVCKVCNKEKPANRTNFYRVNNTGSELKTVCKECVPSSHKRKRNTPQEVLNRYTEDDFGCWIYTGNLDQAGYGLFYMQQVTYRAHRISYELFNGKIKEGLVIDHLCRNKSCINPNHLEAVTQEENMRRVSTPPHCASCTCQKEAHNSNLQL